MSLLTRMHPMTETSFTERPAQKTSGTPDGPVLFFDGMCGLCNRLVDFALRHDQRGALRLAPLQGETADTMLSAEDRESVSSVVLVAAGRRYRRSAAIIRVLWRLGPFWKAAGGLLWLVPLPLRDLGYRLVASQRYRVFGRKETCRMPTPEERDRLLP